MEAEAHGEGETLARHEKILLELAKKHNYNVTQIYKEIVSGETIAARPVMQHLLQEVEQGLWDGVIVVEVERLARGDTIDQGIMAQAFKYSNTLIRCMTLITNLTKNISSSVYLCRGGNIKPSTADCNVGVWHLPKRENMLQPEVLMDMSVFAYKMTKVGH